MLLIEPREHTEFDLADLSSGGTGLVRTPQWLAHAPHLPAPVAIDARLVATIGCISPSSFVARADLNARFDPEVVERLVTLGLLVSDDAGNPIARADTDLRNTWWDTPTAVSYAHQRWGGMEGGKLTKQAGFETMAQMAEKLGSPPPEVATPAHVSSTKLERARFPETALDDLLRARVTCRNFDRDAELPLATVANILTRVFAAHAVHDAGADIKVLKKTSPSGGGLHPLDVYVFAQRVDGLRRGHYFYDPVEHALLALPGDAPPPEAAEKYLAAQDWFATAPVMFILVARFRRKAWKYRWHPKMIRVLSLDAGHLSMTHYLVATELRLGAFVTAAINERDVETALGLTPMVEGPIAILGCGVRAKARVETEFDPLGAVWPLADPSR